MKLLISIAALALLAQEEKVELRWKWQKGQELVYLTSQKNANEFMRQETGTTYSMTVSDVTEKGEATLQVKHLRVTSKVLSVQGAFEYDSDKDKVPPEKSPALILSKLVGQTFTARMTALGEITDIQGFDKILAALVEGAGEDIPGLRDHLARMFTNETFKSTMQQMAPQLPEGKVGKGDAWSSDHSFSMADIGKKTFTVKSTFAELQDQVATIQQEIHGGETREAQGKSTMKFSVDRGCLISQKSTIETMISQQGQEMAMKTTTEVRLVEK